MDLQKEVARASERKASWEALVSGIRRPHRPYFGLGFVHT
jgi:hypothetical protein